MYKSNAAGPTKKAAVGVLTSRLPPGFALPEPIPQKPKPKPGQGGQGGLGLGSPSMKGGELPQRQLPERGSPVTWMDTIDSIRSMATNNGGPIRSKIKAALTAAAAAGAPDRPNRVGDDVKRP